MRAVQGVSAALLLLLPSLGSAQTTVVDSRIFIDVNVFSSASALSDERTFTYPFVLFSEQATYKATYPKPSRTTGFPVDISGGYMFTKTFGVGVNYSRIVREDPADLTATIPHPTFLNAPATATGETGILKRTESATTVFASLSPVRNARFEWRLYGGPAFYNYNAEMVSDIAYEQTADPLTPQNTIAITGYSTQKASGFGVGAQLGTDFAYFFTNLFGVTGGVRFQAAIVEIDPEPLSKISQDVRPGGTVIYLGVRFRLGR